jgi:hypothetical protein
MARKISRSNIRFFATTLLCQDARSTILPRWSVQQGKIQFYFTLGQFADGWLADQGTPERVRRSIVH